MTMFCKICEKSYKSITTLHNHYKYHLKKETDQKQILKIKEIIKETKLQNRDWQCKSCKKYFTTKQHLETHTNKCTDISSVDSQITNDLSTMQDIIASVIDDSDILKKLNTLANNILENMKVKNPEKQINKISNITNDSGDIAVIAGNNNNNTKINVFTGVRSIDHESIDMYDSPLKNKKALMSLFRNPGTERDIDNILLGIDKFINYNEHYPENHNILVTNQKRYKPCMVKENDEWIQKNGDEMKKIFYNRISNCNELYTFLIPDKLKEIFPEKEEEIDQLSDKMSNLYSNSSDRIKKRLWCKFFDQAYFNRQMMRNTYEIDKIVS